MLKVWGSMAKPWTLTGGLCSRVSGFGVRGFFWHCRFLALEVFEIYKAWARRNGYTVWAHGTGAVVIFLRGTFSAFFLVAPFASSCWTKVEGDRNLHSNTKVTELKGFLLQHCRRCRFRESEGFDHLEAYACKESNAEFTEYSMPVSCIPNRNPKP